MSARTSIAILWLLWARLESNAAAADSRERVHIRLHMPEVVRKHTHFHKVYKHVPLPIAAAPQQQLLPIAAAPQSPPVGKPHVSLLGYTTTASGSGGMAPTVMQLMATAATPTPIAMPLSMSTLKPNYGPALFNNYNQQQQQQQPDPPSTTPAPAKLGQQQLLEQLLASITAAQQQQLGGEEEPESELEPQLDSEAEPETQVENNELLNGNFLAALQREYLAKFGSNQRKRKKQNSLSKPRRRPKPQPPLREEYQEDEPADAEVETYHHNHYYHAPKSWPDLDENEDDDSATAFSGQNNAFSALPSIDAFLNDVGGDVNPYAPYYGSIYGEYGNAGHADSLYNGYDGTDGAAWQPTPIINYSQMTKATPNRPRPRQRSRPSTNLAGSGGSGNAGSGGNGATKVRYIKLTTRKKRKNRIRAKRYRT